jgi:hypothetical protein
LTILTIFEDINDLADRGFLTIFEDGHFFEDGQHGHTGLGWPSWPCWAQRASAQAQCASTSGLFLFAAGACGGNWLLRLGWAQITHQ